MDDGAVDGGEVGLRSVKPSTPNSERFNNTERGNQCWRSYLTLAAPEFTGTAFYQVGGMDVIDLAAPEKSGATPVLPVMFRCLGRWCGYPQNWGHPSLCV